MFPGELNCTENKVKECALTRISNPARIVKKTGFGLLEIGNLGGKWSESVPLTKNNRVHVEDAELA
jgi:hypothetical protein